MRLHRLAYLKGGCSHSCTDNVRITANRSSLRYRRNLDMRSLARSRPSRCGCTSGSHTKWLAESDWSVPISSSVLLHHCASDCSSDDQSEQLPCDHIGIGKLEGMLIHTECMQQTPSTARKHSPLQRVNTVYLQ